MKKIVIKIIGDVAQRNRALLRGFFFFAVSFLLTSGCQNVSQAPSSLAENISGSATSPIFVYRGESSNPWRDILPVCSRILCSLQTLPFLGQETARPTKQDVLNRLLVSHSWMGDRFSAILDAMDARTLGILLKLSRSITYFVISGDVRPSHYRSGSSSMYLDPLGISLTEEEASTVDTRPDFRTGFGADFSFRLLWRYVNAENRYLYTALDEPLQLSHVTYYLARLLFHEFAHANDFYPYSAISRIECAGSLRPCSLIPFQLRSEGIIPSVASDGFGLSVMGGDARGADSCSSSTGSSESNHLFCENFFDYARARYFGVRVTEAQRNWTAQNMGQWFSHDGAAHPYSYSNRHEDVAMLTEVALVKYLWQADMDLAFINRPTVGEVNLQTPVTWGVRGFLGESTVGRRAQEFLNRILPGEIPAEFYETGIGAARAFKSACGWLDNLDLECEALGFAPTSRHYRSLPEKKLSDKKMSDNEVLRRDSRRPHAAF